MPKKREYHLQRDAELWGIYPTRTEADKAKARQERADPKGSYTIKTVKL